MNKYERLYIYEMTINVVNFFFIFSIIFVESYYQK